MCLRSGMQFYNLHTLSAKADQISAETLNSQEWKKKKNNKTKQTWVSQWDDITRL